MKITANGKYSLKSNVSGIGGDTTVILISGSTGGGTINIGHYDEYKNFIPFTDGTVLSPSQTAIKHGIGITPVLDLAGSTSSALSVIVLGHQ